MAIRGDKEGLFFFKKKNDLVESRPLLQPDGLDSEGPKGRVLCSCGGRKAGGESDKKRSRSQRDSETQETQETPAEAHFLRRELRG